jgi:hypothetical protein
MITQEEHQQLLHKDSISVSYVASEKTMLVRAEERYIPRATFQETFNELLPLLDQYPSTKMIFDKRALKVFDQPSMVWYHLEWKPLAYAKGVTRHVKILPDDPVFRKSVDIGREKIKREHPEFDYQRYNIVYKENLEEAFAV